MEDHIADITLAFGEYVTAARLFEGNSFDHDVLEEKIEAAKQICGLLADELPEHAKELREAMAI